MVEGCCRRLLMHTCGDGVSRSNVILEDAGGTEQPLGKPLEEVWFLIAWIQMAPQIIPLLDRRAAEVGRCIVLHSEVHSLPDSFLVYARARCFK